MKNILLISSTAKKSGRLDGVTVKSRVLENFLKYNFIFKEALIWMKKRKILKMSKK